MQTRPTPLRSVLATLALAASCSFAQAAGFQHGTAADPDGKPLAIGIWYPSANAPQPLSLGPTTMAVALNAPVQGTGLPLIAMSHGNGGSLLSHADTAVALADAGNVVVAVTHTGDNYADQSRAVFMLDRPRHISRAIDHMLSNWPERARIDAARIGLFGFSSGAFTALVSVGGVADFGQIGPLCQAHPGDYACGLLAQASRAGVVAALPAPTTAPTTALHDPRIRAAVVAAPALGFTFAPDGLKNVTVPVQLWRAEDDTVLPHPRYVEPVHLALPQAPEYHLVPKAGHYDFLAPCSDALARIAPTICQSQIGFDRTAFHQVFNQEVVRFFGAKLTAR